MSKEIVIPVHYRETLTPEQLKLRDKIIEVLKNDIDMEVVIVLCAELLVVKSNIKIISMEYLLTDLMKASDGRTFNEVFGG